MLLRDEGDRGIRAGAAGAPMSRALLWWLGAGSATANAAIHGYLAPMHLVEEPYIGVLFILGAALLAVAVAGLVVPRTRDRAWWLGAAVCAGMGAAYVASRTVGLPHGYHEEWNDPFGTACLLLEAGYLLALLIVVVDRRSPGRVLDARALARSAESGRG